MKNEKLYLDFRSSIHVQKMLALNFSNPLKRTLATQYLCVKYGAQEKPRKSPNLGDYPILRDL